MSDSEAIVARHYDVFVSYKREDDAAREVLCDALAALGYEVFWDAKLGPDYWRIELRERIRRSKLVIALWSARAAQSDEVRDEASAAKHEAKLLSVPIEDASVVPKPFRETNLHPFGDWQHETGRAAQLEKILATVLRLTGGPARAAPPQSTATIPVELGDLPAAPDRLVGRDDEMALLRRAWADGTNAVVLHALGGAGKSALLRAFVNERLARGGDGAARIYGWSAYSQGSGEQKRADADGFISKGLSDFGYRGPPILDAVERARALARLIQKQRVLLLLDGLEPLQDPPNLNKGRFKDKGLAALVKALGAQNPGLVVLTSRQEVPELEGFGKLVVHHPLDRLTEAAGAELLVELGVRGRPRELAAAVHDLDGHALSVTLLGTYLAEVCGGDITRRDRFRFGEVILSPEEEESADKTVRYARRAEKVMAGYLEQFEKLAADGASAGLGGPERALLHLLGLFDRPADGPAVDMLLAERIPGLTDELFVDREEKRGWLGIGRRITLRDLSPAERSARLREARSRLRKLRLIAKPNPGDPHELDAHPVVRAYFSERLERTAPEAAKLAHERLYRHYSAAAPDLPDTLAEMQPLFHAVQHGVKAGRVQEACDEIFHRRLNRRDQHYLLGRLGAIGPAIACVSHFFATPWSAARAGLQPSSFSFLRGTAAFCLTSIGRMAEAVEPQRASARYAEEAGDFGEAVNLSSLLSQSLLAQGEVREAEEVAEKALKLTDRADARPKKPLILTDLAAALAAGGKVEASASAYVMANEIEDIHPLSLYDYCEVIAEHGHSGELSRIVDGLWPYLDPQRNGGLNLVTIGFAGLVVGKFGSGDPLNRQSGYFDAAVDTVRNSGLNHYLPKALLARAAHRRRRVAAGELDLLEPLLTDLAEVEDIAEPEMRLYLTDLALERARLALDVPASCTDSRAMAEWQTAIAEKLIADTGYHRRDGELAELKARLAKA